MRQVLVIEHAREVPVGLLGQIMQARGVGFDVITIEERPLPAVGNYSAVIVLGGPQHVGNYDRYPYLAQEEALIQETVQRNIAYLGICLGGQLLAHALGAQVARHERSELGFSQVQLTEAGESDPLFQGLSDHQVVFQWHLDAFSLPYGAILLASSAHTLHQAFRYGQRAYGLQYHVEVTPETFVAWKHDLSKELSDILGSNAIDILNHEWEQHYPTYQAHSEVMFNNFLKIAALAP